MIEPKRCQRMMEDGEICGALHRTSRSHRHGMTREEHARGAKDWRSDRPKTHVPLTGEQRAEFARQRELIVGETITQPGRFFGLTIARHIRGSQYELRDRGTGTIYAHHKKQSQDGSDIEVELAGGWHPWRQDWHDRGEEKRAAAGKKPQWDSLVAMDEAVRDGAAQEDEAATMAPPTLDSDRTRVELKAIRLDQDLDLLWVVFDVAGTVYHGPLKQFELADLIKREDEL